MQNFVLAIIGQKGGIGKTTFAYNLYERIKRDEDSAMLIDCDDDQYSSADLSCIRKENNILPHLEVINMPAEKLGGAIVDLSKQYKVIIIEFGGTIKKEMKLAVEVADKIIMPLQPTMLDARTIVKVEKKLLSFKDSGVPAIIVPNRVKTNKQLNYLLDAKDSLEYFTLSECCIGDRISIQSSFDDGRSIFEIQEMPDSKKAINEFEQLYKEVFYE